MVAYSMKGFTCRLLVAAVLMILIAHSSIQSVFAELELKYDNEKWFAKAGVCPFNNGEKDVYFAVRFILTDFGIAGGKLLKARFYRGSTDNSLNSEVEIHILGGSDGRTELTTPFDFLMTNKGTWNDADLTSKNIVVYREFWVAIRRVGQISGPCIAYEGPPAVSLRSYQGDPGPSTWTLDTSADYGIRADLDDPTYSPVGGTIHSVNKLTTLAPYVALLGVIAAVAVVAMSPWKKPQN